MLFLFLTHSSFPRILTHRAVYDLMSIYPTYVHG